MDNVKCQSRERLEKALAEAEIIYGKEHPTVGRALIRAGIFYRDILHDYGRAIVYFKDAYTLFARLSGQEDNLVQSLLQLGFAYHRIREYTTAISHYERALALQHRIYSGEHVNTALALNALGATYANLSQYKKALDCFQKELTIRRVLYTDEHESTASAWSNLSSIWGRLDNAHQAAKCYEEAYKIALRLPGFGATHSQTRIYAKKYREWKFRSETGPKCVLM